MANPVGIWDPDLRSDGWFSTDLADGLILAGWFDEDLIDAVSAGKTATIAFTLDSVSSAISATLGHTATAAFTLADVTVASDATLGHSATLAATLDSISTNISVSVTSGAALTATMAVTLDSLSTLINATTGHTATLAATLGDVTFASNATLGHTATAAFSLASISTAINVTVTSPGAVTATVAFTLDSIGFAATANVQSQVIVVDTHDGDYHKKKFQKEIRDKDRRKQQIIDLYEELVELKPKAAEEIIAPFVPNVVQRQSANIDFKALLESLDRTETLYNSLQRELQEIDDEDVLLLL